MVYPISIATKGFYPTSQLTNEILFVVPLTGTITTNSIKGSLTIDSISLNGIVSKV